MSLHFYVSAINGQRKHLIAGPYATHEKALEQVNAVRDVAHDREPMSWFFAWGTCSVNKKITTPLGANWKNKKLQ